MPRILQLDYPVERKGGADFTKGDALYWFQLRAITTVATELSNLRATDQCE